MKFFKKSNHLILVFFGSGLLCFHATLHAMHESGSSSEEFQNIAPAHEALKMINQTIQQLEHNYRYLHIQQTFQCPPLVNQLIQELGPQLNRLKNAFQILATTFSTPGPSRSLNTRCAQLGALINRILIHIDHAQQTLATDLTTSQQELRHACELNAH
jgi:hypothetical protein